ncbi:cyclic nucleotide-binding domain-containing protein [bacterium]|nr:cyclic nucleotide-binding domain-containing protein [bacterium]
MAEETAKGDGKAAAMPKPEKLKFEPGDVICLQGEASKELYLLNTGKLEILVCDQMPPPKSKDELIRKSSRVATIETPGPFGELAFLLQLPRTASVRVIENTEVTKFAAVDGAFQGMIARTPKLGLDFSRNILKRYTISLQDVSEANRLLKIFQRLYDNSCLILAIHAAEALEKQTMFSQVKFDDKNSKAFQRGQKIYQILSKADQLPKKIGPTILEKDHSDAIGVKYGGKTVRTAEIREADFFRKLMSDVEGHFASMIETDPSLVVFIAQRLASKLPAVNALFLSQKDAVDDAVEAYIGKSNSILSDLLELTEAVSKKEDLAALKAPLDELLHSICRSARPMVSIYEDLWGVPPPRLSGSFRKVVTEMEKKEEEDRKTAEREAAAREAAAAGKGGTVIKDTLPLFMKSFNVEDDVKTKLEAVIEAYKGLENKLDFTGDARKVKNELSANYWKVYRNAVRSYFENPAAFPAEGKLLLRYGLLDERMIEPDDLDTLPKIPYTQISDDFPIYFADEWLHRVFEGKEGPSSTELGETFQEVVKRGEDEVKVYTDDATFGLVAYEIDHLAKSAVRMCAGGPAFNFPILCKDFCGTGLEKKILTKEKLAAAVADILKLDYRVFVRDVKVVAQDKAYFVDKEVRPNFILLPSSGSQAICWQELDGRSKETRARIVLPTLLQGDLKDILMDVFAKFRWNLGKTIAGYNWANPAEGGLTGAYFDYVSFYKKNTELTEDEKEKCKEMFDKYPAVGDKFAANYKEWMTFEKEGVQKLNNICRGIFFKFVPFARRIREGLGKFPAFEKHLYKDNNLRTKQIQELETRIKAFENDGVEVPQEFRDAIEFMKK